MKKSKTQERIEAIAAAIAHMVLHAMEPQLHVQHGFWPISYTEQIEPMFPCDATDQEPSDRTDYTVSGDVRNQVGDIGRYVIDIVIYQKEDGSISYSRIVDLVLFEADRATRYRFEVPHVGENAAIECIRSSDVNDFSEERSTIEVADIFEKFDVSAFKLDKYKSD